MPTTPTDIGPIVDRIRHVLAGRSADLQGAVLADLLAIWLAGHRVRGNPVATKDMREMLLQMHMGVVRELIPPNAAAIHGDPEK